LVWWWKLVDVCDGCGGSRRECGVNGCSAANFETNTVGSFH